MLDINQTYVGDCLEVMQSIDNDSIDMILCDLPYGTTKCVWDIIVPFLPLWRQYARIIKYSGVMLLFGNEPFASLLRTSNLPAYRYDWFWEKDKAANFLFANKQPHKMCESISVFYYSQPTYNPQKTDNPKGENRRYQYKQVFLANNSQQIMGRNCNKLDFGENYEPEKLLPKNVIYFPSVRKKIHPTQKPVALFEYLIKTYTNPGELVLDNCAGSGTTGVACLNTGRNFILIEKDEQMAQKCADRVASHFQTLYPNV